MGNNPTDTRHGKNVAERFKDILISVHDLLSVSDLTINEIEGGETNSISDEARDSALRAYYALMHGLKDFLDETEWKGIEPKLKEMPFADIVSLFAILSKGIDSGKLPRDVLDFISSIVSEEAADSQNKTSPVLRSTIPKTAIINNSKLANQITRDFVDGGDIPLIVSNKRAKRELKIVASMTFDNPNVTITSRQPYSAYDKAVYNAICSLWEAGNTAFSPSMVYLAMNGLSGSQERGRKVSPQAVAAVTRSIEKQRFTRLSIDCTEQMSHYKDLKTANFDANMLTIEGVEMISQNGTKVRAYMFTNPSRPPVLYEYSKSIGQVISVSPRLLNTSKALNTTDEVIVLREYLIRRIEGMKGKNSLHSNRIEFLSICEELGLDSRSVTKDKARKLRNNTEKILGHLKEEAAIKSFWEYKIGRTIAGWEITL